VFTGSFPATRAEAAACDHTVQMIVIEQRLAPCLQDGGHSDLRLEPMLAEFEQSRAGRGKEQVIDGENSRNGAIILGFP